MEMNKTFSCFVDYGDRTLHFIIELQGGIIIDVISDTVDI